MRVSDRSSVNRQGAASCVIVTRWSLTTTVPVRVRDCWLAAAVTVTSDSPWPDDGVTRIQDVSVETLHEHSRAAVTVTLTVPPAVETRTMASSDSSGSGRRSDPRAH